MLLRGFVSDLKTPRDRMSAAFLLFPIRPAGNRSPSRNLYVFLYAFACLIIFQVQTPESPLDARRAVQAPGNPLLPQFVPPLLLSVK